MHPSLGLPQGTLRPGIRLARHAPTLVAKLGHGYAKRTTTVSASRLSPVCASNTDTNPTYRRLTSVTTGPRDLGAP